MADPNAIHQALTVLKEAKRPLVIIGKGVWINVLISLQ
jgi:thiamine pyrophosphate-dependent acetolactate synthase large subunit-like protein